MSRTEYYSLVAGLREYALDADTKGFDARAIIAEILENVSRADARQVRLLYGYYDCENLISLRNGRTAHNSLGNFTREELEQQLRDPRRLPPLVARVIRAYADPEGEDAEELDMKKAAKSVGEKSVSMIHVKDINQVTGYIRGGCTAIGMKKQYVTRIDESAQKLEKMIVSGGRLGVQIELKPEDLKKASRGEFADIIFKNI